MGFLKGLFGGNGQNSSNSHYRESERYHDDESEEDEEDIIDTYTSDLGIEITRFPNGDLGFTDPGWDYVYDEDDNIVHCPHCSNTELRHTWRWGYCCPYCDIRFSKEEILNWAGPVHL